MTKFLKTESFLPDVEVAVDEAFRIKGRYIPKIRCPLGKTNVN